LLVDIPLLVTQQFTARVGRGFQKRIEWRRAAPLQIVVVLLHQIPEARRVARVDAIDAPLIAQNMTATNANLINTLYLTILSRMPTTAEVNTATTALTTGTRNQAIQNLMWALYNKVDFVFNY